MEITRIRALRGPNLWSRHTAIEAIVTCDAARARTCTNSPPSNNACVSCFPM